MLNKYDIFKEQDKQYQLRTKNNVLYLDFESDEEEFVFREFVAVANSKGEYFRWDVFLAGLDENLRNIAIDLRQTLETEGILQGFDSEKNEYSLSPSQMKLSSCSLCILGASILVNELVNEAQSFPFREIVSLEMTSDTNDSEIEAILSRASFAIVEAHRWSPYHMDLINELCLKYNIPWLYVDGIKDGSCSLGPLFWGRRLGCYRCLITRKFSNMGDLSSQISYDTFLRNMRKFSCPDMTFLELSHLKILSQLVLVETIKFIEAFAVPCTWRTIIEVNVNNLEFKKSYLLKHPFCPVCTPSLEYNPAPWLEEVSLVKHNNPLK